MEACVLRKWWGCLMKLWIRRWGSRARIPADPQHRWVGPHTEICRETSWTRKFHRIRQEYLSPASQLQKWDCTGTQQTWQQCKLVEKDKCYSCCMWRVCRNSAPVVCRTGALGAQRLQTQKHSGSHQESRHPESKRPQVEVWSRYSQCGPHITFTG